MNAAPKRFVVAMLGARMHYAVPRLLNKADALEHFYTDFSAANDWPRLFSFIPERLRSGTARRLLSRIPEGMPAKRITAFNLFGCEYALRRARAKGPTRRTQTFLWANERFCKLVANADWGQATGVFTFNCAGLEILRRAKSTGLRTVVEQCIAPSRIEQRLLTEERNLHPGWEPEPPDDLREAYSRREEDEWPLADVIICGSRFVKDGLKQCGGPAEKAVVVPYGVDAPMAEVPVRKKKRSDLPLRVLTVGAVGLRKGAPYVLEAAGRLQSKAQFRWVGAIDLLPRAAGELRKYVELTGAVPSNEIVEHFQWADVFLLPSICEGSATAVYEALSWGLPVICTPNTGSVVRHDQDGFIVPIRSALAIQESLARIASSPELLSAFSQNAREHSRRFTVKAYGQNLLKALNEIPPGTKTPNGSNGSECASPQTEA